MHAHLNGMPSTKTSAGLLMFRKRLDRSQFFFVHPGGPFFAKKEGGVWTVPKGLVENGEDLLAAAQREFTEETGFTASPPFHELGSVRQKSGKVTHAWASRVTATLRCWRTDAETMSTRSPRTEKENIQKAV